MSKRNKRDEPTYIAPPASAIRWDIEPLPTEQYDSYLDMVVALVIENRAYRETLQVALERLADAEKRARYRHDAHR